MFDKVVCFGRVLPHERHMKYVTRTFLAGARGDGGNAICFGSYLNSKIGKLNSENMVFARTNYKILDSCFAPCNVRTAFASFRTLVEQTICDLFCSRHDCGLTAHVFGVSSDVMGSLTSGITVQDWTSTRRVCERRCADHGRKKCGCHFDRVNQVLTLKSAIYTAASRDQCLHEKEEACIKML